MSENGTEKKTAKKKITMAAIEKRMEKVEAAVGYIGRKTVGKSFARDIALGVLVLCLVGASVAHAGANVVKWDGTNSTSLTFTKAGVLALVGSETISGDLTVGGNISGTISNATVSMTVSNLTVNGTLTGSVVSSNAVGELTTSNLTANGDATIAGTLGVTGAATLSSTLDADSLTVDAAGAGVDAQSTGKLNIGTATADAIDIGKASEVITLIGPVVLSEEVNIVGTALNVTNAQPVTVTQGCYILNGIGGANNTTNTITLAAPNAAGDIVYLLVATASSNLIAIADSSPVALSAALELDGNDTAVLMAVDGSTWCLLSTSDN